MSAQETQLQNALAGLQDVSDELKRGIEHLQQQFQAADDKHSCIVDAEKFAANAIHQVIQQIGVSTMLMSELLEEDAGLQVASTSLQAGSAVQALHSDDSSRSQDAWEELLTVREFARYQKKTNISDVLVA